MAVRETGVSYYGLSYVEHAQRDFQEMIDHHCTAVLLALSEFDIDFWRPNIKEIVQAGKEMGLTVYLDTWGIGKWFGGEPPSLFLTNNSGNRQVSALTDEPLPAACFNSPAFREYFFEQCERLGGDVDADGFFWDEPHYALPKSYAQITGGAGDDWSCRCPYWRRMFEEHYGYEMPRQLTMDVNLTIGGEGGTLMADCFGPNVYHNGAPNDRYTVQYTYFDEWIRMVDEFVDCVRNGRTPRITLRWHRRTIEAMNACYESIAAGRPILF